MSTLVFTRTELTRSTKSHLQHRAPSIILPVTAEADLLLRLLRVNDQIKTPFSISHYRTVALQDIAPV